jgi:hypothetical protein
VLSRAPAGWFPGLDSRRVRGPLPHEKHPAGTDLSSDPTMMEGDPMRREALALATVAALVFARPAAADTVCDW